MTRELLLRGGTVYDGRGGAPVQADVLVHDNRVVAVGPNLQAGSARVIDVTGLAVAPGFIDAHTHSDVVPFMDDPQPFKLLQGVTTEIVGNCGNSAAPLVDDTAVELHRPISSTIAAGVSSWPRSFAEYLTAVEEHGPSTNVASLVGHHTLRISANGMQHELRPGALERMAELADEAFAEGAFGLSTGLIYAPGSYADDDEVEHLARVAARWGRPYASHMRDEGDRLAESLAATIGLARSTGVHVQVSHCKAAGIRNAGRGPELVETIRSARAEGLPVTGDMYPYTSGESFLSALLPAAAQEGGRDALASRLRDPLERERLRARVHVGGQGEGAWQQTTPDGVRVSMHTTTALLGLSLTEIAEERGISAFDALAELLIEDPSSMMVYELMDMGDVLAIMAEPSIAIGSDNSVPVGNAHRRGWGCFPTALGEFSRDRRVLSLSEMIRKMTSLPAQIFDLTGRGVLEVGSVADIAVFDPATIGHAGTAAQPWLEPTGLIYTVLSGHVVVDEGCFTGERRGRVLRAGQPEPV
ncbi:MAG: N-acyl-D-amino-acid deacylase family protein [Mycetocola sp.]